MSSYTGKRVIEHMGVGQTRAGARKGKNGSLLKDGVAGSWRTKFPQVLLSHTDGGEDHIKQLLSPGFLPATILMEQVGKIYDAAAGGLAICAVPVMITHHSTRHTQQRHDVHQIIRAAFKQKPFSDDKTPSRVDVTALGNGELFWEPAEENECPECRFMSVSMVTVKVGEDPDDDDERDGIICIRAKCDYFEFEPIV